MPSRKYFHDHGIPELYTNVRDNIVIPSLKNADFYAATSDLWTSSANDPYLSFTVHFITNDWTLKSFCLDTLPLYEDHTGANIAEAIQDVLQNWSLSPEKLVATTTDNASNYISAFRSLNWLRLSCFGHNLDLAINKAIKSDQAQRALTRCRSLVELFSRSWKKTRDLREKQQLLDLPEHKLLGDVCTRWGSTYTMIQRILEQQQAISSVIAEDRKNWYRMPSDQEIATLEVMANVLGPLSVLTDSLAAENHITVSTVTRCESRSKCTNEMQGR